MKSRLKAIGRVVWSFAASPKSRRYEIPVAIGLYKLISEAIKHG